MQYFQFNIAIRYKFKSESESDSLVQLYNSLEGY